MERIEKKINKFNQILENPQTQQNRKEKIETKISHLKQKIENFELKFQNKPKKNKERCSNKSRDFPKCERKHSNPERIDQLNQTKQNFGLKLEKKREFQNEKQISHLKQKLEKIEKRIQFLSNKNKPEKIEK